MNKVANFKECINNRKKQLYFYSNYNFIREIDENKHIGFVEKRLDSLLDKANNQIIEIEANLEKYYFYLSYLNWDSKYFGIETYKLINVIYYNNDINKLTKAVSLFKEKLFSLSTDKIYCFMEIPSEDILLIQALTTNSFKLVETRLNYFISDLQNYNYQRFPVRSARNNDINNLKIVASQMRNDFDRFHADNIFSQEIADNFLATYIEEAIKGFCDIVLVPNSDECPPDGFLTANYLKDEWNEIEVKVSKMVLSAVSPVCKGWYKKLISEMTYHLRDAGADYIYMTTQSTNRAVLKVWHDLGYRYGSSIHILSINN